MASDVRRKRAGMQEASCVERSRAMPTADTRPEPARRRSTTSSAATSPSSARPARLRRRQRTGGDRDERDAGHLSLVARFARWVRDAGFTVWMPHLFGVDGKPLSLGYGLAQHGPRLHQPRVPRLRRQRVEPGDRLAARARGARPPALRRHAASARSACASPATSRSR